MDEHKKDKIIEISIDQIQPNPSQPRGIITPDSIMDMADSVKEHGILEPLLVAHTPAGYQIIAGERRWRAGKMAGLKVVPCVVKETNLKGMLELTLVENVQREDLNPLERAKAFIKLKDEFGLGTGDIAKRIGKSPSYISNTLRLLDLPDAVKDGMLSNLITEGHARALISIEDNKLIIEAYKMILRESASVRKTEDMARKIKFKQGKITEYGTKKGDYQFIVSEEIDKIEQSIKESLGDKAKVKLIRTLKQTRLYITLIGNPEETDANLQKISRGIKGI